MLTDELIELPAIVRSPAERMEQMAEGRITWIRDGAFQGLVGGEAPVGA